MKYLVALINVVCVYCYQKFDNANHCVRCRVNYAKSNKCDVNKNSRSVNCLYSIVESDS